MQSYTREQFWAALESRGCRYHNYVVPLGHVFVAPSGMHFTVPRPAADGTYPGWMLDDIIERFDLDKSPRLN